MKIHTTQVGAIGTNCYLVESDGKKCAIVDPGDEGLRLVQWIKDLNLTPTMILITHGHFDHIGGVEALLDSFPDLDIYINKKEEPVIIWSMSQMQNSKSGEILLEQGINVDQGDSIKLDEIEFNVVSTPGHTQGGVVYIANETMFSGDTLFFEEIGRCDLKTGDYDVMLKTLKKLADLSGDYKVYPGHMQPTTLSHEREYNPYMKQVL